MATKEETLALQKAPADEFLALIEKVIDNPGVDAEKLKVIVGLKLQLEDRAAAKAFDAAMQEAQKEVSALRWDKVNNESNKSRWVSFPKIDEMLKPIREKYGFTETFGVEPELPAPNTMLMFSDVIHEGGHRRRYHLPMSISGEGPKGGGVMTGAQAVGNGTSYGMRYLEKLIWKIPMLVDKNDNDGNQIAPKINDTQKATLSEKLAQVDEFRQQKFYERCGIEHLEDLPASKFDRAVNYLKTAILEMKKQQAQPGKHVLVNEAQLTTLQEVFDELKTIDQLDFLKTMKVEKLSDLQASQYSGALRGLQEKRRG